MRERPFWSPKRQQTSNINQEINLSFDRFKATRAKCQNLAIFSQKFTVFLILCLERFPLVDSSIEIVSMDRTI